MSNTSGYIPEEIAVILRTQGHSKDALDKANAWVSAELLEGRPDLSKWDKSIWVEAMKCLERRIQQGYKALSIDDEMASQVKVYAPKPTAAKRGRKFNDGADDEFGEPQTLEDLVIQRCGEDSTEWTDYLRLKGLFGIPKPVELKVVDDEQDEEHGD